jgi:glycosyltransferase involved in cell wall biosynthesis
MSRSKSYQYLAFVRALEIQYSPFFREWMGWMQVMTGKMSGKQSVRAAKLVRGMSLMVSEWSRNRIYKMLRKNPGIEAEAVWRDTMNEHHHFGPLIRKLPGLSRTIVLKAPAANGEKGILLLTFEYNWARLLLGADNEQLRWLAERFHIVLSSSSSPTNFATLSLALSRIPGTVFVQACNPDENARIEGFHPRLKCLPVMPCDWIMPDLYQPKPMDERTRDLLMVAFWGPVKRHWEFFDMLTRLPASLRVTMVGQTDGIRNKDDMIRIARDLGVKQELEVHQSIPVQHVAELQCDAKVSVIMTRREGCCVAAVESLFAGSALAMRADAHIGPLAYINAQTGMLLRPGRVAKDMATLLERAPSLRPQDWASQNISCYRSQEKLDAYFKQVDVQENRPWTGGIVLPIWRPHPTFARIEDQAALRPVYAELHQHMPAVFPVDLITESWR